MYENRKPGNWRVVLCSLLTNRTEMTFMQNPVVSERAFGRVSKRSDRLSDWVWIHSIEHQYPAPKRKHIAWQKCYLRACSPSLASDHVGNVDESSVVLDSLESSALWLLWLLLFLNLWCLRLNLSGSRQRSVYLTT